MTETNIATDFSSALLAPSSAFDINEVSDEAARVADRHRGFGERSGKPMPEPRPVQLRGPTARNHYPGNKWQQASDSVSHYAINLPIFSGFSQKGLSNVST